MTHKQRIGLAVGVLVLGFVFAFVYRQFAEPMPLPREDALQMPPAATVSEQKKEAALPATIDDISQSIQNETAMDLSALDAEEKGEVSEIQADSDSITNLGTSYDENNL
jgi:hypothetical protein